MKPRAQARWSVNGEERSSREMETGLRAGCTLRGDVRRGSGLLERHTHFLGREHWDQAVATQMTQGNVRDLDRRRGRVVRRLKSANPSYSAPGV